MFADTVKTSLLMADCSKFLLQRQSMDTLVHQHGEFVRYSLRRTKPMPTVKQRSDVVVSTGLEDESSRCIRDRLETIQLE